MLRTNLGESIEFSDNRIRHVRVRDDHLEVIVLDAPAWPTWEVDALQLLRYTPPDDANFDIRRVELPGREKQPQLIGDILVPRELAEGEQRPAVLFLGGGSPADRYGFAGPPAVDLGFHEITDALAQSGFVVMRYDERGLGESQAAEISWRGQGEDARRAFRMLLVQAEVDPDRVVVIGHGEGGWRAMQLAIERPQEVVGVASLAAPGRSYRTLFGRYPGLIDSLESGIGLPPNLKQQETWYREILDVDPAKLVKHITCPLWIAQGGKDFEVNPKLEVERFVKAARKHKKKYQVERFPNLDHLFKHEEGVSEMRSYLEPRSVDREFLQKLIAFVRKSTKAKKTKTKTKKGSAR